MQQPRSSQLIQFEIKSDPALFPPKNIEYLPDGLRITVALPSASHIQDSLGDNNNLDCENPESLNQSK